MNISREIYLFYCWLKFLSALQFYCCDKQWSCEYFCLYIISLWLILDFKKYIKICQTGSIHQIQKTLLQQQCRTYPIVLYLCQFLACCCSVIQLCLTLCNLMDCSMSGLPIPHHLPEFVQVHVHCISNDIQLSNPLTHPSASALNLSQHQGLFQ